MKVNHLNLTVTDIPATVKFLETYFGLQTQTEDDQFALMLDDNGMALTLMKGGQNIRYPGAFHIGFIQESEEQVNAIYQRLKDDGFAVEPPQRSHAWTFYIQAPGGISVEVLT